MPPKVKISQEDRLEIKNNLNDISDSYEPLINEVGFLMNTFLKVQSRAEGLEDFADLFGTKSMKDKSKQLVKKFQDVYIRLDKLYGDLKISQDRTDNVFKVFEKYEEFCRKQK